MCVPSFFRQVWVRKKELFFFLTLLSHPDLHPDFFLWQKYFREKCTSSVFWKSFLVWPHTFKQKLYKPARNCCTESWSLSVHLPQVWLPGLKRISSCIAHVGCSVEYYGFGQKKENLGFTEKFMLNWSTKAFLIFTEAVHIMCLPEVQTLLLPLSRKPYWKSK